MAFDDLIRALQHEIDYVATVKARTPKQIRITPLIPEGTMLAAPYNEDETAATIRTLLGTGPYEILINPLDFYRLTEHMWSSTTEPNMRHYGATDDEIDVRHINGLANPQDWQFYGIPVIDEAPCAS